MAGSFSSLSHFSQGAWGGAEVFGIVLGCILYFLPSIMWSSNQSQDRVRVWFMNLVIGWTIIGWGWIFLNALRSEHNEDRWFMKW